MLRKRGYELKYSKIENMAYNIDDDFFVCHNGKKLVRTGTRKDQNRICFRKSG